MSVRRRRDRIRNGHRRDIPARSATAPIVSIISSTMSRTTRSAGRVVPIDPIIRPTKYVASDSAFCAPGGRNASLDELSKLGG